MNKLGSKLFGTTNVKTEEYLLLAEIMTENGQSLIDADITIKFIDDVLALKKIELIINGQKYTPRGRLRKNSSLLDIIDGRLNQLVSDLKLTEEEKLLL